MEPIIGHGKASELQLVEGSAARARRMRAPPLDDCIMASHNLAHDHPS
jgi:hypothetical protein